MAKRRPYNPNDLTTWSLRQLENEYAGLFDAIEIADCYGTSDYTLYLAIESEMARRGYTYLPRHGVWVK